MEDYLSFEEFCLKYSNDEVCKAALYAAKWPDGYRCPRCSHPHAYSIRSRKNLYQCHSCHHQTSLIAGTIFEGSRTPLRLWFQALFLHAQPTGVSATRLTSIIGTTYKTAWLICHKIRHAMTEADRTDLLTGLVRINWAQYGRPYNPTVYLHPQEHILLAGASVINNETLTHVKIMQVPATQLWDGMITREVKDQFISEHVDPNAMEVIAETRKYRSHKFQPLSQLAKNMNKWINVTFRGIGAKHLQAYLNQYAFGLNCHFRKLSAFMSLFQICALTPTITYPILTRDKITRRRSMPRSAFRTQMAG